VMNEEDKQFRNFYNRQNIDMTYYTSCCVKVFSKSLIEIFFMRCRIKSLLLYVLCTRHATDAMVKK
jgi:hypothetical protein